MAYRVKLSTRAADDLEAIGQPISLDSIAYSKAVVKTILDITRKLSHFPLSVRTVPEFNDENIREWVASIIHGRRLLNVKTDIS